MSGYHSRIVIIIRVKHQVSGDHRKVTSDIKLVSGDSMQELACQVITIVDITIIYHNATKWYLYRGSIQMQEGGTDTRY